MAQSSTRNFQRLAVVTGTSPADGNEEQALACGMAARRYMFHSIRCIRSAGVSATNIRPRLYNVSGAAAGTIAEIWRAAAGTAPGTLVQTTNILAPCVTDASGNLYLIMDGDAADQFYYEIFLEPLD